MTVLCKFEGVMIGLLFAPLLGAHFHATHGDRERIVGLQPLRIIQGGAPAWVRERVLRWAGRHRSDQLRAWQVCGQRCPPPVIAPGV